MIRSHKKTIREILGHKTVHPFPARMAPGIALEAVANAGRSLRILDPMMGSGTVLAVAIANGHSVMGIDLDPLAVLISKVWTTAVDTERVQNKAAEVLSQARKVFATLAVRDAYPPRADEETRRFVRFWFDGYARRQLTSLAASISRIRNETIRNSLWCAFSRLIISKQSGASLAMDLSHSRPHRAFTRSPIKPFTKFLSAVDHVVSNCVQKTSGSAVGITPDIRKGDARKLPFADASVDMILTSPPYLNAIDYMRCSKFSLVWMGHNIPSLRQLRGESVGFTSGHSEVTKNEGVRAVINDLKLSPRLVGRDDVMLCHFIADMQRAVGEAARVLTPGGKAVYVIGENTIRGTYIRNSKVVAAAAEQAGLELSERRVRTLPANRRYLPPPSKQAESGDMDKRMRREVVLAFTRPA